MNVLALTEQIDQHRLGEMLMAISVIVMTIWFVVRLTRRQRLRSQEPDHNLGPRERIERIKQVGGMKSDLRELMVEIEQMARRLGAQLDAKTIHLEKLLEEADVKIHAMTNADHRASDESPAEESAKPKLEPQVVLDPLTVKVYALADAGQDSVQIAQKLDEHVGKVELMLALRQN